MQPYAPILLSPIFYFELGNDTYAVGVLLYFHYSTHGRICQEALCLCRGGSPFAGKSPPPYGLCENYATPAVSSLSGVAVCADFSLPALTDGGKRVII